MVRIVSSISALMFLFAPLMAFAQYSQQYSIDPALLQQLTQTQSTSTVSYKLQNLLQYIPIAQSYLEILNASSNDTEAIIARLELMLKDPKTIAAVQALASTTAQAIAANPNQPLIDTLLRQAATIQEQINALTAAQSASTTIPQSNASGAVIACPLIARFLGFGMQGTDVTNLQLFLIDAGFLEAGNVTGFFGKLTEAAVQAWQKVKAIVTEGTPTTTGFGAVGPKTRATLLNCR